MSYSLFGDDRHQVKESQIAKYTGLFGSLFTNLKINKNDKSVEVPIRFSNGNTRNKGHTQNDIEQVKIKPSLPVMMFSINDISEDSTRKVVDHVPVNSYNLNTNGQTAMRMSSMSPEPHNITFELTIRAKEMTDAFLIYEQINSAFSKGINLKVKDDIELDITRTINIHKMQGIQIIDNYDDIETTRIVDLVLNFILKGYLYVSKNEVPVILEMQTQLDGINWLQLSASNADLEDRMLLGDLNILDGVEYE